MVVAEPELLRRAEHAVAHLAADLAPFEREAAGQRRARRRVRHDHARDDVRRAADDTGLGPAPVVDVDQRQLVGVGMLHHVEHARRDHAR